MEKIKKIYFSVPHESLGNYDSLPASKSSQINIKRELERNGKIDP